MYTRTQHARWSIGQWAPFVLLAICFLANIAIFWPGQMTPDSNAQYSAAITSTYGDHHPPIMSVLWKFLDFFHKGPGLLLLLHLLMLYGSAAIFMAIFRKNLLRWLYLFLPLVPPISLYSSIIWKDAAFTFSYLLAAAIMSYFMVNKKRPPLWAATSILAILFYGTGVKYQAQFILPIMLFGFCYLYTQFCVTWKTLALTLASYSLMFWGITAFNNYFVPEEKKNHSWQMVKLYDLAAISLKTNQLLFPKFVQENPNFSVQKIKDNFNYERVDDLVWSKNPPLIIGKTPEERTLMWKTWFFAVRAHPTSYLKHRFALWWTMLNNYPLQRLATLDFTGYSGLTWFVELQKSTITPDTPFLQKVGHYAGKTFLTILRAIRYPLKSIFLVPFILFYLITGLFLYTKKREWAMPLIILSTAGLLLLLVLFVFSMASNARYLYFTACMFHASHGFAYSCLFSKKKEST